MEKLKLLIAEDSKLVAAIYDKGFPDNLFEKRFTGNGKEALEIFNSWHPDILILDVMMPIMTGYEALKEIRKTNPVSKTDDANDEKKSTVVIIATVMGDKEDVMDFLKLGINGYIVKPFNKKEIKRRVMSFYHEVYPDRPVRTDKKAPS